jgi:hypothetical protein
MSRDEPPGPPTADDVVVGGGRRHGESRARRDWLRAAIEDMTELQLVVFNRRL